VRIHAGVGNGRAPVAARRARPCSRVRRLSRRHSAGVEPCRRRRRPGRRPPRRRALAAHRSPRIVARCPAVLGCGRRTERGRGTRAAPVARTCARGSLDTGARGGTVTVAIVTDSAAALPADLAARHRITIVPMWLTIGGQSLREGDRPLSELLGDERVSTSGPAPGEFAAAIEPRLTDDGVLVLTIASTMSGTHEAATVAA